MDGSRWMSLGGFVFYSMRTLNGILYAKKLDEREIDAQSTLTELEK